MNIITLRIGWDCTQKNLLDTFAIMIGGLVTLSEQALMIFSSKYSSLEMVKRISRLTKANEASYMLSWI